MSAATHTPPPDPNNDDTQRPDLHVVRDDEAPTPVAPDTPAVLVPAETSTEVTGPVPVLAADGTPVTARAPWDVRAREKALATVHGVPAFGQVPASFADSLDYSQQGDWATSDRSGKRVVHGLATIFAFVGTYPLVEGLGKAREKPIHLVLAVLVLAALAGTLTALF